MTDWDFTFDFVIVGSGGGGMVAALTADQAGAGAIVLEKQGLVGGSTAMSGGVVWVPDNPVMRADGIPDSYDDAMAHFEAVVGDVGPASSPSRRDAFLTAGPEMVSFLQDLGVGFVHCLDLRPPYCLHCREAVMASMSFAVVANLRVDVCDSSIGAAVNA